MIGVGVAKGYTATAAGGNECVLIGWYVGENGGTFKNMTRTTGIGSQLWRGYPGFRFNGELIDNVAVGAYCQASHPNGWFGSYSTAVGSQSMRFLQGNLTLASYNTALGYRSGVDPRAPSDPVYQNGIYSYQTYVGAYARTNGDISGCSFGVALGYNSQTDASYAVAIGSDVSNNIQNSVRLGRPLDNVRIDGSLNIMNLNSSSLSCYITGNTAITGNIDSSGNIGTTKFLYQDCSANTWLGVTRTYGYYNVFNWVDEENKVTRAVVETVGATANTALTNANNAQSTANSAQSAANSAQTSADNAQSTADGAVAAAASANGIAVGAAAAAATNAASITALTTSTGLADSALSGRLDIVESKTGAMLAATTLNTESNFINRIRIYETALSISPEVDLKATAASEFYKGINAKTISTTAGEVQNLRGSTVNIGDSSGAVNIDCSNVNIGNANSAQVVIGNATSTSITIGKGLLSSTVNVNGALYVNGVLYVPFTPSNLSFGLKQLALLG